MDHSSEQLPADSLPHMHDLAQLKPAVTDVMPVGLTTEYCLDKYSQHKVPRYLADNYWWAYLSPLGAKIFDHPFMVNRILWGQYQHIAQDTVRLLAQQDNEQVTAISCAYGNLIPDIAAKIDCERMTFIDVSQMQLQIAQRKIAEHNSLDRFAFIEATAESLPLVEQCSNTVMIFFLLHELPVPVKINVLSEAMRILKRGGRLIIADYAQRNTSHRFHTNVLLRGIFERMEPFLSEFWSNNLLDDIERIAVSEHRQFRLVSQQRYWHDFYQLLEIGLD